MLFDWSSFYWKSILFWKTDTKRGFVAHIVQVTGGETILARIFFPRANFSRPPKTFSSPLPDFEPENIPLHPVARQNKQLALFSWGKCWLLTFAKFRLFLPFVDKENNQLFMANSPARCTTQSFLLLKLNSRTQIFSAQIHLVCQKIIGFIHPLEGLPNFL